MVKLDEEKLASSSNTSVKPNSSNIFGNGVGLTTGFDIDVAVAVNVGAAVEVGIGEPVSLLLSASVFESVRVSIFLQASVFE